MPHIQILKEPLLMIQQRLFLGLIVYPLLIRAFGLTPHPMARAELLPPRG